MNHGQRLANYRARLPTRSVAPGYGVRSANVETFEFTKRHKAMR